MNHLSRKLAIILGFTASAAVGWGAESTKTGAQARGEPGSERKIFAPDLCRAAANLLRGRLPQDVQDSEPSVEYNYKKIPAEVFINHNTGDFYIELSEIGQHGALRISLGKAIPPIIMDLDQGFNDCRGSRSRPNSVSSLDSTEVTIDPRGPQGALPEQASPGITVDPPSVGAGSVSALIVGRPSGSIELRRIAKGTLPDQGEIVGSAEPQAMGSDGKVNIEIRRTVELKEGEMIFARIGRAQSRLVSVVAKTAVPLTKLDDLRAGQTTVTGFTQNAAVKSIKIFINDDKDPAGTTPASFSGANGKFSVTLDGGKKLSYKDKVVAKPDTGDPSEAAIVGRGLPDETTERRISPNATVAVEPVDAADSEVRAIAPAGMKLSLVKDGALTETKTAGVDGGGVFDVSNLYPRENVAVCSGDPSTLTPDSCATTTVRTFTAMENNSVRLSGSRSPVLPTQITPTNSFLIFT